MRGRNDCILMIKITVISVGRLNEKFWREAEGEYLKRLTKYSNTRLIEIPEYKIPANPTASDIDRALEHEAGAILSKTEKSAYKIALCIEGKGCSSRAFSEKIADISQRVSHIIFIIGSSHGMSGSVKNTADLKLSFSEMTFPHNLARIMLLEQIYRAFAIDKGLPYHK